MDAQLEACRRCTDLKINQTEQHARCAIRSCGCTCRDQSIDLSYPDTRLKVAQLCRDLLDAPFLPEESPEADYVNGLLRDLLWLEMERLLGVVHEEEERQPALEVEEIEALRQLLTAERLTAGEVQETRSLLRQAPALQALLNRLGAAQQPRPRPQAPLPPVEDSAPEVEPYEALQAENESPPPVQAQKPPPKTLRKLQKPQSTAQPMPSRDQMHGITSAQASQAQTMGRKAVTQAIDQGGATGKSQY